jgi:hypothetical protein
MKGNILFFIGVVMSLLALSSGKAYSQDGMPNNEIPDINVHPELNLNAEDKPLIYEPERNSPNGTATQEKAIINKEQSSLPAKPGKVKSTEPPQKGNGKNEEDANSFNFLYYIIQKFKISDIVDQ